VSEPVPCGATASATHCCEYHALHSDDDLTAANARIAELEALLHDQTLEAEHHEGAAARLREEGEAASAKVAELEDVTATEARVRMRLMNDLSAANARAEAAIKQWEDVLHEHASRGLRINSLERDVAAANARAEREANAAEAAVARAMLAESEAAALRETATSNQRDNIQLVTERAELRAEVERLRAEYGEAYTRARVAESRLATATVLVMDAAVDMPAARVNWFRRYKAFVDGQPVTDKPRKTDAGIDHGRDECQCPICVPRGKP
jgi:chromosome segregation ATPase